MLNSRINTKSTTAMRFDTHKELAVHSQTIGTNSKYSFSTENVSRSGMLISTSKNMVPFRVNTILEMTIDPDCKIFERPIEIMARVVRREDKSRSGKNGVSLGVSIIEMDTMFEEWEHCIDFIEHNESHLFENDKNKCELQAKKRRQNLA